MTSYDQQASFRLFITGHTARSVLAVRNAREILDEVYGEYELTITDTLENPDAAVRERIVATPVLIRRSPRPRLRIVGDLTDRPQALTVLRTGLSLPDRLGSAEDESLQRAAEQRTQDERKEKYDQ